MKIALDNSGKLVGITEVANGLSCKCTCLGCGDALVAKNGGTKNDKHFAHEGLTGCGALMTWLHNAAQIIVETERTISLPGGEPFAYSFAKKEVPLTGFIADVMIEHNHRKILIEVVVSHDLDDAKMLRITNSGLECIRIDLSEVEREIELEKLRILVMQDLDHRSWVSSKVGPEKLMEKQEAGALPKSDEEKADWVKILLRFTAIFLLIKFLYRIINPRRK